MKYLGFTTILLLVFSFAVPSDTYYELRRKEEPPAVLLPSDDVLRFVFEEDRPVNGGELLEYTIYDDDRSELSSLPAVVLGEGRQYYNIDLSAQALTTYEQYVVQVTDKRGRKWFLPFYTRS